MDYIDPVFVAIVAPILWAIYLAPSVKRRIAAKKLDHAWKTNQFTK